MITVRSFSAHDNKDRGAGRAASAQGTRKLPEIGKISRFDGMIVMNVPGVERGSRPQRHPAQARSERNEVNLAVVYVVGYTSTRTVPLRQQPTPQQIISSHNGWKDEAQQ